MKFSSRVPDNFRTPVLLVDYLSERFTYHTRADWLEKINTGKLVIDGSAATEFSTVTGKQTVIYDAGEFDEPPADLNYTIIYQDAWLLAVNKPGNLLIHRAGKSFRNNLMYQLRSVHTPPYPEANSIHRLDRFTSGIVLIAKNSEVQAMFNRMFMNREVTKMYTAIIHGVPENPVTEINQPIAKERSTNGPPRFSVAPSGKEAVTRITEVTAVGSGWARLHLQPQTGRTHQLRVHCAYIGHPIVGDATYCYSADGKQLPSVTDLPLPIKRQALHCTSVSFLHPYLKSECTISTPLPDDMKTLISFLEKH